MKQMVRNLLGLCVGILMLVQPWGIRAEENGPPIQTIKLVAVGDIMMHKEEIEGGKVPGTNTYNFDYMFKHIKPYIENADLAIGNLETPLAGKERGYTGYPAFNAPEQLAMALKNTGFDVLTTANNHSLDRHYQGVAHTLKVLDEAGLAYTGTARTKEEQNKVLIQDVKGIKIAFMAYTYGTNGIKPDKGKEYCVNYLSKEKMLRDIDLAKQQGADVICVSLHFGNEYERQQNKAQEEWVKFLFDNGVDIVLGSHPHVLQPMELKNGKFVIYSLGNFVSAQRTRYRDSSILLNLTLTKNFETGETFIDYAEYVPIWTDLSRIDGRPHFRVMPVEEALSNYRSGQDAYLSTQDYNKLMTSLADTKGMYKHTPLISKAIKIDGYIDQYLSLEEGGITLVEARKLGQALGMEVKWDAHTMQMLLIKDGRKLTVLPGSRYIYEGDKFICLEAATRIIEGKVFIPLRGLSEYIGKKVEYTTTKPWISIY